MKLKSRLAQRLDAEISAWATQPNRLAGLQVQRALLWARHGRMDEARAELNRLHQRAFQQPRVELAAWLHFVEGLMAYFNDFFSAARERVERAQRLAADLGLEELDAHCQAWLAHMAVIAREPEVAARYAQAALAHPGAQAGSRFRAANALALAWSLCGAPEAAGWFSLARQHALADGDDAALAALLYNQTQTRALQLRVAALRGQPGEAPAALLSVESISHYDSAVGGSSQGNLTPLLRAQLLVLQGDWAQAAPLLEAHLPAAAASGLSRLGLSLLADLAWCWVQRGDTAKARTLSEQTAAELRVESDTTSDIEDRAAAHARLAEVRARLGDADGSARHAAAAEQAWLAFDAHCEAWKQALDAVGLRRAPT
jgi:hypothetical protein